jgi:acyl-coenzyme A synthetase/AMP-(fatty) acid ligase
MSCVIGVPDPLKMQKVKVFIMLKRRPANEEN